MKLSLHNGYFCLSNIVTLRLLARACSLIFIVFFFASCSTVRFNERERLAQSDMQFASEPLKAELESHVYSAREGASGSFSEGGGGGCGCY